MKLVNIKYFNPLTYDSITKIAYSNNKDIKKNSINFVEKLVH